MQIHLLEFELLNADHLTVIGDDVELQPMVDYIVSPDLNSVTIFNNYNELEFVRNTVIDNQTGTLLYAGKSVDAYTLNKIADYMRYTVDDADNTDRVTSGMLASNNLSELTDMQAARNNLDVYSKGEINQLVQTRLSDDDNLYSLTNKATARANLGVYSKAEWDAILAAMDNPVNSITEVSMQWKLNASSSISGNTVTVTGFNDNIVTIGNEEYEISSPINYALPTLLASTTYYIYLYVVGSTVNIGISSSVPSLYEQTGSIGYGTYTQVNPVVGIFITGTSSIIDDLSINGGATEIKTFNSNSPDNNIIVKAGDVVEMQVYCTITSTGANDDVTINLGQDSTTLMVVKPYTENGCVLTKHIHVNETMIFNEWPSVVGDTGVASIVVSHVDLIIRRGNGIQQIGSNYNTLIFSVSTSVPGDYLFGFEGDATASGWDDGVWHER